MSSASAVQHKTSFCRICEAQCGLKVSVENNRIIDIKPDEDHVVSKGYACIKGLTFEDFRTSPDRLTTPLKKVNGEFVPISYEQAFKEIGAKVRQLRKNHGDDSVGLYFGNPISFSLLYPMFVNGLVRGLKTSKFFNTGTLDCNNKFVVSDAMYGAGMALTFPDVDRTQFLMVIGGNPAVSKMSFINLPHPMKRLKAIEERGGRVVHLNPRKTESAHQGGEHLFIRPDTDVFFLFSFLHAVLASNTLDETHITKFMSGFSELKAVVQDWPAEKTAAITQVPAPVLHELVQAYLQADGAALYLSTGVNQGTNGTLAFWALEVINAVTGNLDRLGGVQMGQGIVDYAKLLAGSPSKTHYSRIGNVPSFLEALPSALMADEILTPGEGQVRAMFVVSGNPLLTATRSERFEQALESLELLVSIEIVRNETANHADYILPGTHFAERPDLPFMFATFCGTMPVPYMQYTEALVKPPAGVREELWQFSELAKACDAPMFGSKLFQFGLNFSGALARIPGLGKKLVPMNKRLLGVILRWAKLGSLKNLGKHVHGKLLPTFTEKNYLGKRVVTVDGMVNLAPSALLEQARTRLPQSFADKMGDTGFRLITKRERFTHNSWAHNHPKYVANKRHTNYLYINPGDAEDLELTDGEWVSVTSAAGQLKVPVCHDNNMMPGSVALPHGWGHEKSDGQAVAKAHAGVNANILAADGPENIEPLSGMAQFNGIPVEIAKIHG
jgi:anaerobic selenocysteine-containing dehydrogenase